MPLPIDLFEEKLRSGDLRGVTGDLNASTNISRYEKKMPPDLLRFVHRII